ncbi:hypothetical protein M407DRAFT_98110 [Tulasnella calospora MUT 4182]|uniref:Uncharacterized protein n=1 Tax=Tulasnella calospora MUT 4182 TaxID=1051891 RepID=A0A0C3QGS8_9AGAM|nr:hypothetical protein M407DRAFT_98110 [Tulasnella calospora MUT 4182]
MFQVSAVVRILVVGPPFAGPARWDGCGECSCAVGHLTTVSFRYLIIRWTCWVEDNDPQEWDPRPLPLGTADGREVEMISKLRRNTSRRLNLSTK